MTDCYPSLVNGYSTSYSQTNPIIETFSSCYKPTNFSKLTTVQTGMIGNQKTQKTLIELPTQIPFCNDAVSIDPPDEFAVGLNQRLANQLGEAHPFTYIAPIVIPPTHALDYWRDNNVVTHSAVNDVLQEDMYLSGYAESTCCDYLAPTAELVPEPKYKNTFIGGGIKNYTREDYVSDNKQEGFNTFRQHQQIIAPTPVQDRIQIPYLKEGFNTFRQHQQIIAPTPVQDRIQIPYLKNNSQQNNNFGLSLASQNKEPFCNTQAGCNGQIIAPTPVQDRIQIPYLKQPGKESYSQLVTENNPSENDIFLQPNQPGWVNTECGYNPEQIFTSSLPSNYIATTCEKDPKLKQFNQNLHTQIVTPGVYTTSQINQPINANIGITFQQQLPPVSCKRDENGLFYTRHDPRIVEPALEVDTSEIYNKALPENVYDPRQYGYGTSYRSYIENITGQPRFMYDDIDAIRMPNYVVRSNVDHLPFQDQYGPIVEGSEFGNVHNPNIRALTQDAWMRDSLQFRNDLTEMRMEKRNAEMWQLRQAPHGPKQATYRR